MLERAERQITLGRLQEKIEELWVSEPTLTTTGLSFQMESFDHRRDLVHVVRLLIELRVLVRVHGDEQQFVLRQGDVLYNVHRATLSNLLAVRRAPSSVSVDDLNARLAVIVEELFPDTEDGRNRRLRWRLTRRFLEEPIVYFDQLPADETAYLTSQRALIAKQIRDTTGLHLEAREEGLAFVDEGGALTDFGLPEEGTEGHLTLLLAEFLAAAARASPGLEVPRAEIHRKVAELVEKHRSFWRKDATIAGADVRLAEETLERLEALGLVRRSENGVVPRPAIGRYALEPAMGSAALVEIPSAPPLRPRRRRTRSKATSETQIGDLFPQGTPAKGSKL